MLDVSYIDNFVSRLPIDSMDFGDNVISNGDVVECYAPEYSFSIINNAIRSYNPYSSKIVDNGTTFVEVRDTIYVDGLKTDVRYLFLQGDFGKGTRVKMITDSVYSYINHEVKQFSGFNTYSAYIDKFVV